MKSINFVIGLLLCMALLEGCVLLRTNEETGGNEKNIDIVDAGVINESLESAATHGCYETSEPIIVVIEPDTTEDVTNTLQQIPTDPAETSASTIDPTLETQDTTPREENTQEKGDSIDKGSWDSGEFSEDDPWNAGDF